MKWQNNLENIQNQQKDIGKITIFLTGGSRKSNWEDREYTEKDIRLSAGWTSAKREKIQEGVMKPGMKSVLQNQYPQFYEKAEAVDICNASTEEEIWSVFETIYNTIEEGDEIIFDITHGFRSIPMLVITVINYAKVLKNCHLKGIHYGAYEASEIKDEIKYVPVMDLTVYDEILDWTNAAEAFIQYGIASKMKDVYDMKMDLLDDKKGKGSKREWDSIKYKVYAMDNLSAAIFACRGADGRKLNQGKGKKVAERSIKSAYERLVRQSTEEFKVKSREIKPLYPLMEKIDEKYRSYFEKEKNYEIGLSVVKWSIENKMVQQGYTALEETIKTYLCDYYGLDEQTEKTRDGVIGEALTGINKYIENHHSWDKFEQDRESEVEKIIEEGYVKLTSEKTREVLLTIPAGFAQLSKKVKDKRNDINHFGFNATSVSSEILGKELKKYYDKFCEIINGKESVE